MKKTKLIRESFLIDVFLFLDEPDCWIANESMPNYAKLLHQLSHHFNLQILMVTHKPVEYFQPYANRL